ncbi:sigma-70 family RNA polymerase sigma factor [candidate division KSB1 bacterium]|nr:sigma-70 family RNA polymerase sigma factor [candidate division KSB1 bacterium]
MSDFDDDLMRQLQRGETAAFRVLVERYKHDLFRFILSKVKNREQASDLTQDVFLRLLEAAAQYQPAGKFKAWLFRMARHLCIDFVRKQARANILPLNPMDTAEGGFGSLVAAVESVDDPEANVEFWEMQTLIQQALDALPENYRTALVLCQYHGLSYREIAEIQGCPLGTVKSRIHAGLSGVREYFKTHGII